MKKIVLLVAFAFLGTTIASAQDVAVAKKEVKKVAKVAKTKAVASVKSQVEGPGLVFESETVDYGTIAQNSEPNREFRFTNNGNKPLIISNAQGSCGCTVPTYPKEPIAPGAKGVIGVRYATDRVGAIDKSITLTTNVVGSESKIIKIKGTVNPAPSATVTPANTKS